MMSAFNHHSTRSDSDRSLPADADSDRSLPADGVPGAAGLAWLLVLLPTLMLVVPPPARAQQIAPRANDGSQPRQGIPSRVPVPQRGVAGPIAPAAAEEAIPRSPLQPTWIPLPAKHQEYVDQILGYWEHKSSQIDRFRCTFKRWEYDPVFGPKETFYRYGEGQIKFANPDKGLYKVEKVLTFQAPKAPDGKPSYVELPNVFGEHWVCNGASVYELDHQRKRLIETELPPEMRGEAIRSGPLPFLFGAKKEDIQRRYWVRVITPADVRGEYWLEAYPKTREDGANFKMVHIIIDEKDYLPKGLVLFDRSFVAGRHPARTTFSFENRETNWNILVQQLNVLHKEFYEPSVPRDWEKVVNKYQPGSTAQSPPDAGRQQR